MSPKLVDTASAMVMLLPPCERSAAVRAVRFLVRSSLCTAAMAIAGALSLHGGIAALALAPIRTRTSVAVPEPTT